MPVSRDWPIRERMKSEGRGNGVFGERVEKWRTVQINIDVGEGIAGRTYASVEEKTRVVREMADWIEQQFQKRNSKQLGDAVVVFNTEACGFQELELFSKALYYVVTRMHWEKARFDEDAIPARFVVLIPSVDLCEEFVRLFSVFYLDGIQEDMRNVQIAIASPGENGVGQVHYILAGTMLNSVWESANASAHYSSTDTLSRLPVLAYLVHEPEGKKVGEMKNKEKTQNASTDGESDIALFPFDLYLTDPRPDGKTPIDPWKDSWFLRRTQSFLETEPQTNGNGCLLNDVHIRLGSKVHLSRFYEAQLLFHDSGNVFRFAYLVAQDLLFGKHAIKSGGHVTLLGYEKYSGQLVQQVCRWLYNSRKFDSVNTAIVRDGQAEGEVLFEPQYDRAHRFTDKTVQIISLLPVGTTLSTVYKMHNCVRRIVPEITATEAFKQNYCLVLVNEDLVNPSGTLSNVTSRYWSTVEQEQKRVTARPDKGDGVGVNVQYLLTAGATWHTPEDCNLCDRTAKDVRPLIAMTRSEIMPRSIFLLRNRKHGFFQNLFTSSSQIEDNNKKIHELYGSICYSHIYMSNNHLQFYIDFDKFFRENRKNIIKTIKSWKVDADAYHVVVAPLLVENAPFIQAVLDHVFHGNNRFIHLDFAKTYREEVRVKFSHICEEFKLIRIANPKAKI